MRYHFHEELNTAEMARKICEIYEPDALKERVVRKWFTSFRVRNFSIKDEEQLYYTSKR